MTIKHFNQIDLARRWRVSERTLERWRWLEQGPPYLKIGGRVIYRLDEIEAYETAQAKNCGKPAGAPCIHLWWNKRWSAAGFPKAPEGT